VQNRGNTMKIKKHTPRFCQSLSGIIKDKRLETFSSINKTNRYNIAEILLQWI
jgi:hypothetical protein